MNSKKSKAAPTGAGKQEPKTEPLTVEEKTQLAACEKQIADSATCEAKLKGEAGETYRLRAVAFYGINKKRLYRDRYRSFEEYATKKFGLSRAHANRLVKHGEIVLWGEDMSRRRDIITRFTSGAHFEPLESLDENEREVVLAQLAEWGELTGDQVISPKLVQSATLIVKPPTGNNGDNEPGESPRVKDLKDSVARVEAKLGADAAKKAKAEFDALKAKIAYRAPKTGITWTEDTWNVTHGCSPESPACLPGCYAAKLYATRLAQRYPGLSEPCKGGFAFNGVIKLAPERLGEPLANHKATKYFVCSESDLFHKDVPEEYLNEVFSIMEQADWHTFLVLTKRTKRMAEYLAARYGLKQVPEHIWIGTTIENQDMLDVRLPILKTINATVRWISAEPLLGPLERFDLEGIGWVIVGGEKGYAKARQMKPEWARTICDACKTSGVPLFFKQWTKGLDQDGKKLKKGESAALDGVVYHQSPDNYEQPTEANIVEAVEDTGDKTMTSQA